MKALYFGYGSNLHPGYLSSRVSESRFLGVGKLDGYHLFFNKLGRDGSGKANLIPTSGKYVYGAIYEMSFDSLAELDNQEGGYSRAQLEVRYLGDAQSNSTKAYLYIAEAHSIDHDARPFSWYTGLMLAGARYHQLPKEYGDVIKSVSALQDHDTDRNNKFRRIIQQLT